MRLIKYYSCALLLVLSVSACLKDKGNYTYTDINEVTIEGIKENTKLELYTLIDTLKLHVDITSTLTDDDARYSFEWKLMPASGGSTEEANDYVIGHTKQLQYPITLDPGEYRGYLNVYDDVEGLRWTKIFDLLVRSLSNEGYMVLSDDNGSGRLDMIAPTSATEYRVAYDVWREEDYNLGKPLGIMFNYNMYDASLTLYATETGTYRLDKNLKTSDRMNLTWLFGGTPDRVDIRAARSTTFRSGNVREVMVDKSGDLYGRDPVTIGALFEFPINKIGGTDHTVISPHIGMPLPNALSSYYPYDHTIMLYDDGNKQFLEIRNGSGHPTVMTFTNNNLFPVQTGRDMVHAQSTLNRYTFAILKEPSENKFYLYGMTLGSDNVNSQAYYMEILQPQGAEISKFAIHPTLPYVFMASEGKVYQFDYSQPTLPARLMLDYGAAEVRTIGFYPVVGWNPYMDWERNKANILVVGTVSNGREGTVEFFNVPPLGAALQLKASLEGFGNIIDIAYRER